MAYNATEQLIMNELIIPEFLRANMRFSTTGIGGLFLEYASNNKGGVATLNSKVSFKISFDTCTKHNTMYPMNLAGCEMYRTHNIRAMMSILQPVNYMEVVKRVNNWIYKNKALLANSIEN